MDREELDTMITALTNCESAEEGECPEDCPMKDDEWKREGRAACRALVDDDIIVPAALIRRTVALLQAQEGVFPRMVGGIYECPKCRTRVDQTYKYCKCCGQAVKWE